MYPSRQRFTKAERLCSRKIMEDLFDRTAYRFHQYPLTFTWKFRELPTDFPVQVVFPVAARRIRKAHDRNFIRRKIKEAWRLNKHLAYEGLQLRKLQCAAAISFSGKPPVKYAEIEASVKKGIDEIIASAPQPVSTI